MPLYSTEHVYLKTPNISRENIIGSNVGIRPCRKSGIRIEAESFANKLIIHNYGYGGSGITLCFGGSKEVLDVLNQQKHPSNVVAVLGAGVVGLATAYDLLDKGYEVHIYSSEWNPNLTSNVAAGYWTPLILDNDVSIEKQQWNERVLENSRERFLSNLGDTPQFAGIRRITCYNFRADIVEEMKKRPSAEEVIVHFDNGVTKNGLRFYELCMDGKLFIDDMHAQVVKKGAFLHQQHFENLEDVLRLQEPIIVNCMSLGSREIFNDKEFAPIRGQLIYLKPQEGVDYFMYEDIPSDPDFWVSFYPWNDRFIIGGVYETEKEELVNTPEILNELLANAARCLADTLTSRV